jgi:hypothetical protein
MSRAQAIAATFDSFLDLWCELEPRIYDRVDRLGTRECAQGTVEDFANLFRVMDETLQALQRGTTQPAIALRDACAFVRLWTAPDDLLGPISSLATSYEGALTQLLGMRHTTEASTDGHDS